MAEAFLNYFGRGKFEAKSAGLEPGTLNPIVVKAMQEVSIDISRNKTKSVQCFMESQEPFDYVITVCDETSAERCPIFPGKTKRLHWGFPDPSGLKGSEEERLSRTREIRDEIHAKVEQWIQTM